MHKNRTRQTYYCSFCDKSQEQVKRLIAGPNFVFVCDECATAFSTAEHAPQTDNKLRCSFCGKSATQVQYLSRSGSQGTRICSECVNLCLEIIAEENS